MWDASLPKKPFYRRKWFIALAVLAVAGLLTAVGGMIYLQVVFGSRAAELDLSKLGEMENASIVYGSDGNILGRIYIQNRDVIALDQIPGHLVQALVAAEDNRFFDHPGLDIIGVARAFLKDFGSGRFRQGASTVTQQLARNSFPEVLPSSDRTFRRKILEAFVALRIERQFTKDQILEFYFNRVYFGSGFYGIEAAAHGYFGKSARDLTLSEAATLTGMLKSPNNLSPWKNRQAAIGTRDFVLGRMLELGMIDQAQYDAAISERLAVKNRRPVYTESYAVEFIRQQVAALIGDDDSVYGDGYRIYTSIDSQLQQVAERSLKARLTEVEQRGEYGKEHETFAQYQQMYRQRRNRGEDEPLHPPKYLQGSLVAMDNVTGGVLAMVGGRDYSHSEYNRALFSHRPPGTAFLPIVYAAAYENGVFPGSVFSDTVIDNRQVMIGGTTGVLGEWGPERADNQYEGNISAHEALVKSKNAASVRLGMTVGLDPVIDLAKRARIDGELRPYPATFLGSSEITLEDLTLAFTMFPNGGERPAKPYIIERVEQKDGMVIYERPRLNPIRVIKPSTAYEVHSSLADSLEFGTADKAYSQYGLKRLPLGGKTGTAYNFTDVWFVGYSSAITCGVWAGFDSPQPIYRGGFSNRIVLPVWVDFMNASFARYPAKPFIRPQTLRKYEVCRESGMLATDECFENITGVNGESIRYRTTFTAWGTEEQAPTHACHVHSNAGLAFLAQHQRPNAAGASGQPRALPVVDPTQFVPVALKASTVLGDDPFGTRGRNDLHAEATPTPKPAASEPGKPQVLRAQPVRTLDRGADSAVELEAPPAIEF